MEPNNKTEFYRQYYTQSNPNKQKMPRKANPYMKKIRFSSTLLGLCIIIYLAVSYFVPAVLSAIALGISILTGNIYSIGMGMSMNNTLNYAIELVSYILSYTIPFIIYGVLIAIPRKTALPLKRPKASVTFEAVCVGFGASAVGTVVSQLIYNAMAMSGVYPIAPDFSAPPEPAAAVLNVIMLVVAAPLFEEFVFRGVIMQSMRRFGDVFALVVSALLFSLFHGNLVQSPNAFIMGLVIGFFVIKSGSVWTGVIMHFANNLSSVIFTELTKNCTMEFQNVAFGMYQIAAFAIGIIVFTVIKCTKKNYFKLNRNHSGQPIIAEGKKYLAFITSPTIIIITLVFISFMVANTASF